MKKLLMSVMVGVLLSVTANAGEGWLTDFEKAKKLSAETGKPILADFSGSDWCMWCVRLDEEVFQKEKFKKYAEENLVLLLLDFPRKKKLPEKVKKQNYDLASKYSIRGYPTVLLLDKGGEILARTGYQPGGPEAYIKHLNDLLKK